jgi:hypothetical protein
MNALSGRKCARNPLATSLDATPYAQLFVKTPRRHPAAGDAIYEGVGAKHKAASAKKMKYCPLTVVTPL